MEHTSMDAIGSKINLRAKDNLVTWISCMGSLQTLMKESGDQLYRYYRYMHGKKSNYYLLKILGVVT
jgi:hypothetical protein